MPLEIHAAALMARLLSSDLSSERVADDLTIFDILDLEDGFRRIGIDAGFVDLDTNHIQHGSWKGQTAVGLAVGRMKDKGTTVLTACRGKD